MNDWPAPDPSTAVDFPATDFPSPDAPRKSRRGWYVLAAAAGLVVLAGAVGENPTDDHVPNYGTGVFDSDPLRSLTPERRAELQEPVSAWEQELDQIEEETSRKLDNYYERAEMCDIESPGYLQCVNRAADEELDFFGSK